MPEEKTVTVKAPVDFMSLVKFDKTKKDVLELAQKSKELKINGIEDKEGYKAVHEAQMVLREIRVKGEKDRLEFSRMLNTTRDKLKDYHDDIFSPVIEEEARLKAMKDEIEDKKQKIKDEEIRKKQELIEKKVLELTQSGMVYNPMSPQENTEYVFGELRIDLVGIATITEEKFKEFLAKVKDAKKTEDTRIAAEEAAKKEREEVERKEREAFAKKQKEQEEKEAELQKKENELNAEKERIANEEIEKKRKADEAIKIKKAAETAAKETEERIVRETKEKVAKEKAAEELRAAEEIKEKAAKEATAKANKKYIDWLAKHGVKPGEVGEGKKFFILTNGNTFTLCQELDTVTF